MHLGMKHSSVGIDATASHRLPDSLAGQRNPPLLLLNRTRTPVGDQFTGPSRTESGTPPSIGMALRFALATIGWLMSDVTITGVFGGTRS